MGTLVEVKTVLIFMGKGLKNLNVTKGLKHKGKPFKRPMKKIQKWKKKERKKTIKVILDLQKRNQNSIIR